MSSVIHPAIHPAVLWKDRKRILGMPISFTRYSLEKNRLMLKVGLFSIKEDELLLYRVLDISMKRSLIARIFRVGTITLFSSDRTDKTLVIKNVARPGEVKDLIGECVEKERLKRRVGTREMFGSLGEDEDDESLE